MSEPPITEFPFEDNLRKLQDTNKEWLKKVQSLYQLATAKVKGEDLPSLDLKDEMAGCFKVHKQEESLKKRLASRLEQLARRREYLRKIKEESANLDNTINESKAERKQSTREIGDLKLLDPFVECYGNMFDLRTEVEEISKGVYKVSIKFLSNPEMAPVVISLDIPGKQILNSTDDDGDVRLKDYTNKLGKYFLYLRTKYSKAH